MAEAAARRLHEWGLGRQVGPVLLWVRPQRIGNRLRAETAALLVDSGAVSFRTSPFFRLTSGVESPIYVDNRILLGHPLRRSRVVDLLQQLVEEVTPSSDLQGIAGTATAGIPWASWLADRFQLPLLYVRSGQKAWGHQRTVEGCTDPGGRVVIVEDLLYSAGSAVNSANNLREAGYVADSCVAIVTYGTEQAVARLEAAKLRAATLTDLDETLSTALRSGTLSEEQGGVVKRWLLETRRA